MYALRGYNFSFDNTYLADGEKYMKAVLDNLALAQEHAVKYPKLAALKEGAAKALTAATTYDRLIGETKDSVEDVVNYRDLADHAAQSFMEASSTFLSSQNRAMVQDIARGVGQAALNTRLNKITWTNDVIDLGNSLRIANFRGQLLGDYDGMQKALDDFQEVDGILTQITRVTVLDVDLRELDVIKNSAKEYTAAMTNIIRAYRTLDSLNTQRIVTGTEVLDQAQGIAQVGITTTQEITDDVVARVLSSVVIVLIGLLVALLIAVVVAVFLTRMITSALKKGVVFAIELSQGILSANLDVDQKDEIGELAEALRTMRDKLSEIVRSVASGSEQIATASEQLAEGNQDLSTRTEQQASALEETSSAIEEMNASIKSNADNTTTADQLSREAVVKTEDGTKAVSKMVTSMTEISESSNRIADIIEVINNIAFQTNLLALNASIEAARAGEQGKGFAVVAVEVRKLAKRSDKAASEIADIIKNSNKKVEEGVEIASTAGEVLNEINAAVRKVTALVSEISAASQEQLSSVDQIDQTLSSLDENTQKNAALVEEAASSTEELSAQAQELNSTMQFFKLDTHSGGKRTVKKLTGPQPEKKLLNKPEAKHEKPASGGGKKNEPYESFSDLVDEGEFDEF